MKRSPAPYVRCFGLLAVCLWLDAGAALAQDVDRTPPVGIPYRASVRIPQGGGVALRPFLVQGSFSARLDDRMLPADAYVLDEAAGAVLFLSEWVPPGSVVHLSYRAFALGVEPVTRLGRAPVAPSVPDRSPAVARGPLPAYVQGLRSRGSVSRGVIAGSGRDPAIESGLRLDVEGEPAPGVRVAAALTDETLPIRPDGSTQRIDEFDRVAITITAPLGTVRLGDFDLGLPDSRFARLQRKVQGVSVEAARNRAQGAGGFVRAAGAAAKGEFRVQTIRPIDGVQGPYRLEGESGERFILVVPGSDVVWLDGVRLERGDGYTIDYSTGEIHFGPRVPITSDRRILAEFSYGLDRFTRTLVASEASAFGWRDGRSRPRFSLGATVLSEIDSGDFASEFGLSAEDSVAIAGAGDGEAVRSGAVVVAFDPEAPYVQYRKIPGGADSIFVALDTEPGPGERVYRVTFSRVPDGSGSYRRAGSSVNGIVYAWAPGSDYEPVRRLPVPRSRSLVDFRASVRPVPAFTLRGEWARSVLDRNRMSTLDAQDDAGSAAELEARWRPSTGAGFEAWLVSRRVGATFSAFERIRPVEFARDWNLVATTDPVGGFPSGAEESGEAGLRWRGSDSLAVAARVERLALGDAFAGSRWSADVTFAPPGRVQAGWWASGVRSEDHASGGRGSVHVQRVRLDAPVGQGWRPGVEGEFEERILRDGLGRLAAESIRSLEIRPSVARAQGLVDLSASAEYRAEAWPSGPDLVAAASSWTGTGAVRYKGEWSGGLTWGWRARRMTEAGNALPGGSDTRSVLIRTDLEGHPLSGITVSWRYDAGTERTPTLQEVYFRAGPERGEYVWVDANGDGLLQLDEFLPETTPDEGLYVRTFLPSDSLAAVSTVRARLAVSTDAERRRSWSARSTMEVEERSTTPDRADVYLLRLDRFRREGSTVDGRLRLRNDLSWRAPGARLTADAAWTVARSLSGLAAGTERREEDRLELRTAVRAVRHVDLKLEGRLETTSNASNAFASRTFDIRTRAVSPGTIWRVASSTELRASLELARKTDSAAGRGARVLRLPASVRLSRANRGDLVVRAEWADVALDGNATGLAAWELTDGRGPGRSWLWGATLQWTLGSGMQALLSYDGRAPGTGRVVHTGRAQLTARF